MRILFLYLTGTIEVLDRIFKLIDFSVADSSFQISLKLLAKLQMLQSLSEIFDCFDYRATLDFSIN
jgi:hypothetical protein